MRLAQLTAFGDFWRIVREFNPEAIEREATYPLTIPVVGEEASGRQTLMSSLVGGQGEGFGIPAPFSIVDLDPAQGISFLEDADLIVAVARADLDMADQGRRVAPLLGRSKVPLILVFTHLDQMIPGREARNAAFRAFSFVPHMRTLFLDGRDSGTVRKSLLPMLLEALPQRQMALARQVPQLRELVAEQIISDTCKVNAQFALVSNLPAYLPLIGGIAGNVADFVVLTKNQVMMVFRLAAMYGRDIAPTGRVMAEIAPVIGGGVAWRTAARMVAGMFPSLVAAAPKMAIAYIGTFIAGHAARYYYDEGRRPPRGLLRQFGEQGSRRFKDILARNEIRPPRSDGEG